MWILFYSFIDTSNFTEKHLVSVLPAERLGCALGSMLYLVPVHTELHSGLKSCLLACDCELAGYSAPPKDI